MGKMLVLTFSDSEEYALKEVIKTLSNSEKTENSSLPSKFVLNFPGLEIHLKEKTVSLNHNLVPVTHQEFLALTYMAKHPGWVFTREQIYTEIYGEVKTENIDNSIYCLIRGLRKKIEADPKGPQYIQTVRGIGYKFVIPEE